MILTGPAIRQARQKGTVVVDPFDPLHLNPNSYNFHLHDRLLVKDGRSGTWNSHMLTRRGFLLVPSRLYLGATAEIIGSSDYIVTLLGKSSVGRLGIFLNITADLGHLGCRSRWTLEITVVQPVRVYPGMCIGQVAFWRATGSSLCRYAGRYLDDLKPEPNSDRSLVRAGR